MGGGVLHSLPVSCLAWGHPALGSVGAIVGLMVNFQMFKLVLEKAEESEIKLPTFVQSQRKQENSIKTFTSASLTTKAFDCVDHNKL